MNSSRLIAFINHQTKHRMHKRRHQRNLDTGLMIGILLLCATSLVNLYSANPALCLKQALYMITGFIMLFLLRTLKTETLYRWAPYLFLLSITLLLLVLGLGYISKGAQRWLHLGAFNFQPSEITKITLPMMLSWYLHKAPLPPKRLDAAKTLGLIAIPALLVCKQPDLGTALILMAVGIGVLVLSGLPWRYFISGILAVVMATPILWHRLHSYQKDRILTFLNPEQDPLGKGYHIIQSKIAIGSGGFWGKGWQLGSQSHLHFLPEHSTDFVFSLWGEEFGFIGNLFLMMLFGFITWRLLVISAQAHNTFSRLLSGSFALLFVLSYAINLGMVMGMLPVVGVPLPFMSYGGSHLLTSFLALGIVLCIHRDKKLVGN